MMAALQVELFVLYYKLEVSPIRTEWYQHANSNLINEQQDFSPSQGSVLLTAFST